MPAFKTEVPHKLTQDEAVEKLKGFVESAGDMKGQVSDFSGEWTDSTLHFKMKSYGLAITGTMAVSDSSVLLEGTIPFAAMPFKGKIEKTFSTELSKVLNR
jgi:hypothetical protein